MQARTVFVFLITFLMFSSVSELNQGYEFQFSPTQRYIKYHGTITLDITTVRVPNWSLTPAFKEERHCSLTIDFDINFTSLFGDIIFGPDSDFLGGYSMVPVYFTGEWSVTPQAGGTPEVHEDYQVIKSVKVTGSDHGEYGERANAAIWGLYKRGVNDIVAICFAVVPLNVSETPVFIEELELEWRREIKTKDGGTSVYTTRGDWSVLNPLFDINLVANDLCGFSNINEELSTAGFSPSDVGANLEATRRYYRAFYDYTKLKTHFRLKKFNGEITLGDTKITYSGTLYMRVVSYGFFLMIGGESWVKPQGANNYTRISEYRENVKPGDEVKTSDSGRAEIALSDGSKITLSPNTTLTVVGDDENPETWNSINLTRGKVAISLEPLVGRELEIQTPNVIISLNSTGSNVQVTVEFDENDITTVIVIAGEAEIQETVNKNKVLLEQSQKITIPTLPNGLDQSELSKQISQIDPNSVERWWEQSFISCSVSPETITIGDSVKVSGSLDPALTGENITLTYTRPDGSSFKRKVTTMLGSFFDVYEPDASGLWRITASWSGNQDFKAATSKPVTLTVNPEIFIKTPLGMASILGASIAVAVAVAILKRKS